MKTQAVFPHVALVLGLRVPLRADPLDDRLLLQRLAPGHGVGRGAIRRRSSGTRRCCTTEQILRRRLAVDPDRASSPPPARWCSARSPAWRWRASAAFRGRTLLAGPDHRAAGHARGDHRPVLLLLFVVAGAADRLVPGSSTVARSPSRIAHITFSHGLCHGGRAVAPGQLRRLARGGGAWISGARPRKVFFRITLPLILPAILSGWLLAFTLSWDDLVITQFVAGPGSSTLPMVIFSKVRLGVKPGRQCARHHHGADRGHRHRDLDGVDAHARSGASARCDWPQPRTSESSP